MDFWGKNIPGREESHRKGARLGKIGASFGCQGDHCVWSRMTEGESEGRAVREGPEQDSEGLAGHGKEIGSHSKWKWKPLEGFEQERNMI